MIRSFSSFYTGKSSLSHLETLKGLGYQTPETERRRQLIRMRCGMQKGPEPSPLLSGGPEQSLNPWFWKAGDELPGRPQNIAARLGITLEERIRVVDIGAMDIKDSENHFEGLLRDGMAEVTGFEPLEEECRKLNASASANRRFLPHAVGDGPRRAFHITNTGMTSSLFEPTHELASKFQNLDELMQVVKTVEMDTVRLDDIAEIRDTDFLKLDVQGAEKMILDNASEVLKGVLVIQTEVEFVPLYKGQPLFADIDRSLRAHGFEFHRILGTAGRAFKPLFMRDSINRPISQMLWADAVYVKDFMALGALSEQKLLKYAVIMHEMYRSLDLCHLVLAEYDRRTGHDLSVRYLGLINERPVSGA
jgi:FkbM family methyltransferase